MTHESLDYELVCIVVSGWFRFGFSDANALSVWNGIQSYWILFYCSYRGNYEKFA